MAGAVYLFLLKSWLIWKVRPSRPPPCCEFSGSSGRWVPSEEESTLPFLLPSSLLWLQQQWEASAYRRGVHPAIPHALYNAVIFIICSGRRRGVHLGCYMVQTGLSLGPCAGHSPPFSDACSRWSLARSSWLVTPTNLQELTVYCSLCRAADYAVYKYKANPYCILVLYTIRIATDLRSKMLLLGSELHDISEPTEGIGGPPAFWTPLWLRGLLWIHAV